jgi:nondiscriminating aspartyl-tRNA synthetase
MNRQLIRELNNKINETVKLNGWIHKIRKLGRIAFIILRDRTGIVQCVVDTKTIDIKGLKLEAVVEILGTVTKTNNSSSDIEVQVTELNIISKVIDDLPIEINKNNMEANLDTILDNRVLSLRNLKINAIFKIQAEIAHSFSEFLQKEDFTEIFTPKIVAEGAEGGTELFEVKYFDKKAYLAQSPQFYKQMLVGAGYERVYEIGHVYRAESHDTKRHVNEFVSLDLEMAFIEDERELINLETNLLKFIFKNLKIKCSNELSILEAKIPEINGEIPCLPLPEAIKILREKYNKINLSEDIDHEGEELISQYAKETFSSDLIFLTHYPKAKRPMYTKPSENGLTHSFDLIFRGIEITTGGQRINDYDELKNSIIAKGLNPESFSSYLDIFKYGIPPHGGLAIGLERLTSKLLNLDNIREATLFVRDRYRFRP